MADSCPRQSPCHIAFFASVQRLRPLVVGMPKGELSVAGDIEVLLIILEHAIIIDAASPATLTGIPRPLIRKLSGLWCSCEQGPVPHSLSLARGSVDKELENRPTFRPMFLLIWRIILTFCPKMIILLGFLPSLLN